MCSLLGEEIKTEGSRSGVTNGVGIVVASNHFLFSLPPPPPGAQQFLFFFFFFFNSCCYPNFLLLDCCVPHPDRLQHVPLVNKKNYTTQKKKRVKYNYVCEGKWKRQRDLLFLKRSPTKMLPATHRIELRFCHSLLFDWRPLFLYIFSVCNI